MSHSLLAYNKRWHMCLDSDSEPMYIQPDWIVLSWVLSSQACSNRGAVQPGHGSQIVGSKLGRQEVVAGAVYLEDLQGLLGSSCQQPGQVLQAQLAGHLAGSTHLACCMGRSILPVCKCGALLLRRALHTGFLETAACSAILHEHQCVGGYVALSHA